MNKIARCNSCYSILPN